MKRRILVVDDDDATRQAAAKCLQMMSDWDVVEAYCGAQAIESATAQQPDAILLDVMMPAMDGPAMLAKLRTTRATSHIPVVLITGKVQAVKNGAYAHLPVAAILVKPFDPLRLASQIAYALGWETEAWSKRKPAARHESIAAFPRVATGRQSSLLSLPPAIPTPGRCPSMSPDCGPPFAHFRRGSPR
jgi:CheY-like chemotaxis protein